MKNGIVIISALAAALSCTVQAQTNTPSLTGSFEVAVLNAYYGRGMLMNDYTVIQPSLTVNKEVGTGTVWFNAYGNMDPREYFTEENYFNEMDLTIGYVRTDGRVTWGAALGEYTFSHVALTNTDTHEILLNVAVDMKDTIGVTPALAVYYDFKETDGAGYFVSISRDWAPSRNTVLVADTGIGWGDANYNDYNFDCNKAALDDWSTGVTLKYTPFPSLTTSVGMRYGTLLDSDVKAGSATYYPDVDKFTWRLGTAWNF